MWLLNEDKKEIPESRDNYFETTAGLLEFSWIPRIRDSCWGDERKASDSRLLILATDSFQKYLQFPIGNSSLLYCNHPLKDPAWSSCALFARMYFAATSTQSDRSRVHRTYKRRRHRNRLFPDQRRCWR